MIGIFDSGIGGLSVARAIRAVFPSADLLYFGDTKNAPYGEKTPAELAELTVKGLQLLQREGAHSIVSACNSVSTSLAVSLLDAFSIAADQVIEMVGPTVARFKGSDARILLVATTATVRSGIYQNAFRMIGKEIDAVALPNLAGAIERGADQNEQGGIIRAGLGDYDTLILGCTHYPFAEAAFRTELGDAIALFDPATAVADRVLARFWPREVGNGTLRFLASAKTDAFVSAVAASFPGYTGEIEVVE
jgi:glutamate racemase